jgi:hypothetical protein
MPTYLISLGILEVTGHHLPEPPQKSSAYRSRIEIIGAIGTTIKKLTPKPNTKDCLVHHIHIYLPTRMLIPITRRTQPPEQAAPLLRGQSHQLEHDNVVPQNSSWKSEQGDILFASQIHQVSSLAVPLPDGVDSTPFLALGRRLRQSQFGRSDWLIARETKETEDA